MIGNHGLLSDEITRSMFVYMEGSNENGLKCQFAV